ncbi:MAG: hypothetical protein DRJ09_00485 [Bacteroidetes bacterium]|nr:MAG: hypothetical protein DRJ09_00485 [Bacteroidota bacterium]
MLSVYVSGQPISISNLAALRTQVVDGTTSYQLTGEVLLTFQQSYRNQKFIQDATAAILLDDNDGVITTSYSIGDGITGITGVLTTYKGMLQFKPSADPGSPTSTGNVIIPSVITVSEFLAHFEDYESQLIQINNLTFTDAGSTFANFGIYPVSDPAPVVMNFKATFWNRDYIGTTIPSAQQDIVGVANERDSDPSPGIYITARNAADMTDSPAPVPLGTTGIIVAVLLISAVLVVRKTHLI